MSRSMILSLVVAALTAPCSASGPQFDVTITLHVKSCQRVTFEAPPNAKGDAVGQTYRTALITGWFVSGVVEEVRGFASE